jgi:hypothetical protein
MDAHRQPSASPATGGAGPAASDAEQQHLQQQQQQPQQLAVGAGPGCGPCRSNDLVGSSILQEASYSVTYGERGAGVVLVASEPITGSTTDWVGSFRGSYYALRRSQSILHGSQLLTCRHPAAAFVQPAGCKAAGARRPHGEHVCCSSLHPHATHVHAAACMLQPQAAHTSIGPCSTHQQVTQKASPSTYW